MLQTLLPAFAFCAFILSVIVHEVAHGAAALSLGDDTAQRAGRLTLNPLRHIDMFGTIVLPLLLWASGSPFLFGYAKPVPYNIYALRNRTWAPLVTLGAGIFANITLAVLFGIVFRVLAATGIASPALLGLLLIVVFVNILLFAVNLMPIPPFDGRLLLGLLAPRFVYRMEEATGRAGMGGFAIGILIAILIIWPLMSPIVPALMHLLTGYPSVEAFLATAALL